MSNLFDLLDIDEATGIDTNDVAAIKRLLDRMRVEAAQVAKTNDTKTTIALLEEMVRRVRAVSDVTSLDELHAGLAKDSSGAPAKALGAGPTSSDDNGNMVNVRMTADDARQWEWLQNQTPAQNHAIRRLLMPAGAPGHLDVENDGTPKAIKGLENQVTDLKTERDAALDELAKERDPKSKGSLAEQLETEKAKKVPSAPADMVKKDDVKEAVGKVKEAVGKLGAQRKGLGAELTGKPELDSAVGELDKLAP